MPDKPQKTVFVLGAGASHVSDVAEPKLPLMKDFMTALSDVKADYPELCRYLRKTYRTRKFSGISLEDLFTQLELDIEGLASARGYPEEALAPVRRQLLRFVRWRLHIDLSKGPLRCDTHARLLAGYAQGLSADCVLTLNYDLVLDATLWADTSDPKGVRQTKGPLDALYDLLRPRENVLGAVPSLTTLERVSGKYLKLHGSVGWLYCANETCPNHHVIYPEYLGYSSIETEGGDPCSLCGSGLEWVMVPPTMRKSFEKHPKLGLIWRLAHEELKAAGKVVFFGVSMAPSDYYLHWLIRSSLVYREPKPEVIVINPCKNAVRRTAQLTGVNPQHYEAVEHYLNDRD